KPFWFQQHNRNFELKQRPYQSLKALMLRKDGWQCEQLRLQMDYEISMALFIEAPQVRQNGGLYRFCPYPRVLLPMADIGLSIGPALALCPAGKSMATQSDPVFQSFLSSFSGNFSVKFSKNVTCVRKSPVSQRPLASPKYLLLQIFGTFALSFP